MIIVLAKITSKDGMKDKIIGETDTIIKATRAEEGCIEYNLYEPTDSENILLFVEKWEGKEFLQAHIQQDHFIKFGEAIGDYLAKDLEISVYSAEETEL